MRIESVQCALLKVPLGGARGGSGATEVQLVHVTVADSEGRQGTGFTYALTGGGESIQTMIDTTFAPKAVGTTLAGGTGCGTISGQPRIGSDVASRAPPFRPWTSPSGISGARPPSSRSSASSARIAKKSACTAAAAPPTR